MRRPRARSRAWSAHLRNPPARAFEKFKQLADRKVQIGEDEIRAIVEEEAHHHFEGDVVLVGLHVAGGNDVTPSATATLNIGGSERQFTGEGDGMVHAAFAAIRMAFDSDARLVDYRVVPVTSGADAMAEINVVVRVDENTYSGSALNTDVVEGSAEAFVEALNKSRA